MGWGVSHGRTTWLLDTMESLTGGGTVHQPLPAAIRQQVLQLGGECLYSNDLWHGLEYPVGDSYGAAHGGWAIVSHDTQDHCVRPQWEWCPCLPRGGDDNELPWYNVQVSGLR